MYKLQQTRVALCFLAFLLALHGCGFHLRTTSLSTQVSNVDISSSESPRIARALERGFEELGIGVVSEGEPEVRIHIQEHRFVQEASHLVPRGGLVEYELTLRVRVGIEILDVDEEPHERMFTEAQRVAVNADNLLATSAEDVVVRRELVDKVVHAVIRHTAAVVAQSRNESP